MFHLPDCDEKLSEVVRKTFETRGDKMPENMASQFKVLSTEMLKRGWASAVSGLAEVESFDEVFAKVIVLLEQKFS